MESLRWLYTVFLAREAWVRIWRAREDLKEKVKQKYIWRRDFRRESRSTYRYNFCSEQVSINKRLKMRLKYTSFVSS